MQSDEWAEESFGGLLREVNPYFSLNIAHDAFIPIGLLVPLLVL
jgi:hypothetical protein